MEQLVRVINVKGAYVEVLQPSVIDNIKKDYMELNQFNAVMNCHLAIITKARLGGTNRHVGIFNVFPREEVVNAESTPEPAVQE